MADSKPNRSAVQAVLGPDDKRDDILARTVIRPEVQAGALIQSIEQESNVNALIEHLRTQITAVQSGDLKRGEAMLTAQAHSLDALFGSLARRAVGNFNAGNRDTGETYLRLAFKAQSQCRGTWEALAEIKNPRPVAYVRQANIANGPQQVNNSLSHAEKIETVPNKLLERQSGERLDAGTASTAGRADQTMEAVGTINGAKDESGKGSRGA